MIKFFTKNENSPFYAFIAATFILSFASIATIYYAAGETAKGQLEDFKNGEPIRCSGPDSPKHCFMAEGLGLNG